MARTISKGQCAYCGESIARSWMVRHLVACPARQKAIVQRKGKPQTLFHLQVDDVFSTLYWLHVEMPGQATLVDLDQFLRDIWLECCGHLSEFRMGRIHYNRVLFDDDMDFFPLPFFEKPQIDENLPEAEKQRLRALDEHLKEMEQRRPIDKDMNFKLSEVVKVGDKLDYTYDFGTSSELVIKVIGERQGAKFPRKNVELLARNNAPIIPCIVCGDPAVLLCTNCSWDGTPVCKKHSRTHECGDEMMLPVVNSPRAGMCGYTG